MLLPQTKLEYLLINSITTLAFGISKINHSVPNNHGKLLRFSLSRHLYFKYSECNSGYIMNKFAQLIKSGVSFQTIETNFIA